MIDYASRLRAAMDDSGVGVAALAATLGVSYQAVARVLNGSSRAFNAANNAKAAEKLGVSAIWLATGTGQKTDEARKSAFTEIDLENHPDVEPIPTVKLRLRAGISGFSVEAEDELGTPLFVSTKWMRRKGFKREQLLGLPVYGNSMDPTLRAGDYILINTSSTEPKDGKIFAINYEGEAIIKRLVRDGGQWWLSSDNLDQRQFPRKLCADAGCLLIGELVFRQSEDF